MNNYSHLFSGQSDVHRLYRSMDWSKTAIGHPSEWPAGLRTAVNIMLQSGFPMFVAWGSDRTLLYNDAYAPFLGEKHPRALGLGFYDSWEEIREFTDPLLQKVEAGESVTLEDQHIVMFRHKLGVPEDTYFTFSYSPILAEADNKVVGLFCACVETTQRVHSSKALLAEKNKLASLTVDLKLKSEALENSLNGFDIVDQQGNFVYVNHAYVKMWGYSSPEEVLKTRPSDHCVDPQTPLRIIQSLKASGQCDIEFDARRKDGSTFTVRMLAFLAHDQHGNEIYPTTSIDISEQRRAHEVTRSSEALFRELVDTSPAMIWITDTDSKCVYLSQRWYDYTGRTPEQDLGLGWLENIHPDDLQNTGDMYMNAVSSKGKLSCDYRLRAQDGTYRWMVDIGFPRFGKQGEFLGYIGTVTDIHDRIQAVTKLNETTERFQRSARASDVGVWYCDLPFDYLEWSVEVKRHFFLPDDYRVTIKDFYERIHPEDREPTRLAIEKSITTQAPYDIHYRTTNPANPDDIKWIRAVGWTDYNRQGQPIRFDGITLDATVEFHRNEELVRARDEADRANQLKSAFLANMSHEIRTPLGAMLGFADILRDPHVTRAEHSNYLDILTRNGEQLSVIINDILDLSKVEAGHLSLEFTETHIDQISAEVISLLRVTAKDKDLALNYECDESTPKLIVSDPTRMRQVLLNLVSNAIKFTRFGSVKLRSYGCEGEDQQDCVCFEIVDTGIGLSDDQREKIFDVFVQADGSMTRKFGGTGLGLTLSRRLARALGGDVTIVRSELGRGTTFLFRVEDQRGKQNFQLAAKRAEKFQQVQIGPETLAGLKILVVDDAPDNQRLIWQYLSRHGAMVESAENGLLGYKRALAGDFDLVLMDIQMPEMDGYTATQKLRAAGFKRPIIALTAHAMNEVRKKCMNVGCTDHLVKPINPKELISTIAHYTSLDK